jgi:hypothetical protein
MRILVLVLVLANVIYFVWDHYLRVSVSPTEHIHQVQMAPEKIKLVRARPLLQPAQKVADVPHQPDVPCLQWGTFMGPDIARAEAAIAQLALSADRVQRVQKDAMGYWVLIPPLPGKDETNKVMASLKAQGVTDFSLVTEPASRQNAISLGIFRSEDAAQSLLAAVRNKGFTNAVLEPRDGFFRQVVFYIREPDDAVVARLATLRDAMAGTEVKAVGCSPQ